MRIGCGLKVHRIKGHEYVYFWHCESEDGARKQVQDYVGPASDPASRSEAARRMAAYYVDASRRSRGGAPSSSGRCGCDDREGEFAPE